QHPALRVGRGRADRSGGHRDPLLVDRQDPPGRSDEDGGVLLQGTDLSKTFGSGDTEVHAVDGVSFTVPTGVFAAVVGRSARGKSTLLSLLGALHKPTSGTIEVDGEVISRGSDHQLIRYRRNQIGFVFQSYNLIPNLSALQNVMLPMEFAGVSRSDRRGRAEALLDQVGLKGG